MRWALGRDFRGRSVGDVGHLNRRTSGESPRIGSRSEEAAPQRANAHAACASRGDCEAAVRDASAIAHRTPSTAFPHDVQGSDRANTPDGVRPQGRNQTARRVPYEDERPVVALERD